MIDGGLSFALPLNPRGKAPGSLPARAGETANILTFSGTSAAVARPRQAVG
jgi:hypothetical protein